MLDITESRIESKPDSILQSPKSLASSKQTEQTGDTGETKGFTSFNDTIVQEDCYNTTINMDRIFYGFKVILLGDVSVGKSSIFSQFFLKKWDSVHRCTLSGDFKVKSVIVDDYTVADLQVWDTCGQERFRTITSIFYRDINGAMIIFDLTNPKSFEGTRSWLQDVRQNGPPNTVILLIGNKSDDEEHRRVSAKEAIEFSRENGIAYIEVSAKTGKNIENNFSILTMMMIKMYEYLKNTDESFRERKDRISLASANISVIKEKRNKSGCCK